MTGSEAELRIGKVQTTTNHCGTRELNGLVHNIGVPGLSAPQVLYWHTKMTMLQLSLQELPRLLKAAVSEQKRSVASAVEGEIRKFNGAHDLRLAQFLETTANTVYSLSEIAASIGWRLTKNAACRLPNSFHMICKKAGEGKIDPTLVDTLGDLSWYFRLREMRTEWAHFSVPTVITAIENEPRFRVQAERHSSERKHLEGHAIFTFSEYARDLSGAVQVTERFAHYLLEHHVIPRLSLDEVRSSLKRGADGFPLIEGGRMVMEELTVREQLKKSGIEVQVRVEE